MFYEQQPKAIIYNVYKQKNKTKKDIDKSAVVHIPKGPAAGQEHKSLLC